MDGEINILPMIKIEFKSSLLDLENEFNSNEPKTNLAQTNLNLKDKNFQGVFNLQNSQVQKNLTNRLK